MVGVIRSSSTADGKEVGGPRKSLGSNLSQMSTLIEESIHWGATTEGVWSTWTVDSSLTSVDFWVFDQM